MENVKKMADFGHLVTNTIALAARHAISNAINAIHIFHVPMCGHLFGSAHEMRIAIIRGP